METPELIYCANGNKRFAQIAINAGFSYGAQLPGTVYHSVEFADQNWKAPDRDGYMTALKLHKPRIATVLDLEREEQFDTVLDWAHEAAEHVETVIIIPKVFSIIPYLPTRVGGANVRLGYSVPTRFGGTDVPAWEFAGWPVHLLGGSPHKQMKYTYYLSVVSIDCNYHLLKATKFGEYWINSRWKNIQNHEHDSIYSAFAFSCENIRDAWKRMK